jgi:hypothetical protein
LSPSAGEKSKMSQEEMSQQAVTDLLKLLDFGNLADIGPPGRGSNPVTTPERMRTPIDQVESCGVSSPPAVNLYSSNQPAENIILLQDTTVTVDSRETKDCRRFKRMNFLSAHQRYGQPENGSDESLWAWWAR